MTTPTEQTPPAGPTPSPINPLLQLAGLTTPPVIFYLQSFTWFLSLASFFKHWLNLDILTLITAVWALSYSLDGIRSVYAPWLSAAYWSLVSTFSSSVSIAGHDRLNREVLNWLGANVIKKANSRILSASSERIYNDSWHYRRFATGDREDTAYHQEKRAPVQYLPTFGWTWFFHDGSLLAVTPCRKRGKGWNLWGGAAPDQYSTAPGGDEPLLIMCLGRSVRPIKDFLEVCRKFADAQRAAFITVRTSRDRWDETWDTTVLRMPRRLETVHFDQEVKDDLVADLTNYLEVSTRQFYRERGIPYRKGYLLYGPPGTGKTSLTLALATHFKLEIYLLHIPSVRGDNALEKLFTLLPPRCIVLLEDIDAVGLERSHAAGVDKKDGDESTDEEEEEEEEQKQKEKEKRNPGGTTLSGLLNVLDGVSSQEGRIVMMTSNYAEKLDKALIRPGRVDKMVYLGFISQKSCELMFLRMYGQQKSSNVPHLQRHNMEKAMSTHMQLERGVRVPELAERVSSGCSKTLNDTDSEDTTEVASEDISEEISEPSGPEKDPEKLAHSFSVHIPSEVFTPAAIQGYLLKYRDSPTDAVENIDDWVKKEQAAMEKREEREKKAIKRRRERRRKEKLGKQNTGLPSEFLKDPQILATLAEWAKNKKAKKESAEEKAKEKTKEKEGQSKEEEQKDNETGKTSGKDLKNAQYDVVLSQPLDLENGKPSEDSGKLASNEP